MDSVDCGHCGLWIVWIVDSVDLFCNVSLAGQSIFRL